MKTAFNSQLNCGSEGNCDMSVPVLQKIESIMCEYIDSQQSIIISAGNEKKKKLKHLVLLNRSLSDVFAFSFLLLLFKVSLDCSLIKL